MTTLDWLFLLFLILDVLFLAVMAFVGWRMMQTAKATQRQLEPAVTEAKALADLAKGMAMHAKNDGQVVVGRIKQLTAVLKQRAETTKRIATELKPAAQETLDAARETGDELRNTAESLKETAASVQGIIARLGAVKTKAESAAATVRVTPGG